VDEKDFKKHLQDLAHGHHHAEEHDWPEDGPVRAVDAPAPAKPARKRATARKRRK